MNNTHTKEAFKNLEVTKKLIVKSSSISDRALALAMRVNDITNAKNKATEIEKKYGMKKEDKPYGLSRIVDVENQVLKYDISLDYKKYVVEFIENLEKYQLNDEDGNKIILLKELKEIVKLLRDKYSIDPKKYIINETRFNTWNILEHNYIKTIKKHEIDDFFNQLRVLYIKYPSEINYIKEYYGKQEQAYIDIAIARKKEDEETLSKQYELLSQPMNTSISNLIKDTGKIIEKINFNLESLPDSLSSKKQNELQKVLPAISEYYIDQTYALSGGYSYSEICKSLQHLQEKIDSGAPISEILMLVDNLDHSIQHLYILHWIAETLLKHILKCFEFSCTIGRTAKKYFHTYTDKKANFRDIMKGIEVRNHIAHSGLIWNPDKIKFAIKVYRQYISDISFEQKVDLNSFRIPKSNREFSEHEKKKRTYDYIKTHFFISSDEHNSFKRTITELTVELEQKNWSLSDKRIEYYSRQFDTMKKNIFAKKYLNLSYKEIQNHSLKDEIINRFTWLYNNQNDKSFDRQIKKLKMILGS